ncbi:MAG: sugar phosphate isomerase/epimerase [Planctomycetota bacterium]|nr:sugar phosphate isomerase/epimerase [Planctomycetota bacterium]
MNRRDFLVTSAAVLAASRFGFAAERKIRKAVKFGMVREGATVLDKFKLVKSLGFDGIEMDSPTTLDLDEVLRARDAAGLPIHGVVDSVHWRDTLTHAKADVRARGRAGLETALRDCKKLGGSTVLLVPGVVNREVRYDHAYERSQAEIRKVLPLAAELEIKIAIENVWNGFLLSPLEAARYVDEFESPWIGWYMDIGNIVNYGWPEQWVRILGKRIFKLDIKEFSRKKRNDEGLWKGFAVKIGDGDCGWPEVMLALDEIGYEGWATAEVGGGGRERLADIKRRMDAVLG